MLRLRILKKETFMYKSIAILFPFLLGVISLFNPVEIYEAKRPIMTRGKFVDLLIRVMGLEGELPPGAESLLPDDLYQKEVETLAKNGLIQFVGTNRTEKLMRRELPGILYDAVLKVREPLIVVQKVAFLAERGLIRKGKSEEGMTEEEVLLRLTCQLLFQKELIEGLGKSRPFRKKLQACNLKFVSEHP
jgi:hypothetical protein